MNSISARDMLERVVQNPFPGACFPLNTACAGADILTAAYDPARVVIRVARQPSFTRLAFQTRQNPGSKNKEHENGQRTRISPFYLLFLPRRVT